MVREHDEKPSIKNHGFPPDLAVDLAPEALRAYDVVVRPNAILPIPLYFMEQWLPLLGTSRAWLVLSFRQVAFVSRSSNDEVPVHTTLRKLGHWCGLSHVRIHQVLKDPEYLNWFVRNPQGELADRRTPRSQPTTYMVRSDIPLTPQDQARLSIWFEQRSPSDDKDWILTLGQALEAKKVNLPEDFPLPQESRTIQQMVYAQRGDDTPLPPGVDEACTELHARWVQPDHVTLITHYFLVRWLSKLSPGLGWLIVYLRSRAYQQRDDYVGNVWIQGGWSGIADTLGVSRRSLTRWVSSSEAKLFFQPRSDAQDPTDRRNLLVAVRLSEPIHPSDQDEYQSNLDVQNLTSPIPIDGHILTSTSAEYGQSLTSCGEVSTGERNNLTSSGQNLPTHSHFLTSEGTDLNKSGPKLNALKDSTSLTFKNSIQVKNQQPDIQNPIDKTDVVLHPYQWQLEEILTRSGIGKKIKENLVDASEHKQASFIGWLLFALSVSSIRYPVLFALKRNAEGLPPNSFLQLAFTPIPKTYDWLIGYQDDIPPHLGKAVEDLKRQRGYEKLIELGAIHPTIDETVMKKGELKENRPAEGKRKRYTPPVVLRSDGLTAEKAWEVARGQMQAEVDRVDFETWVRDVEYLDFEDGVITLGAANDYAREWLEDRLTSICERVMTGIIRERVKVRFETIYEGSRRGSTY